MYYVCVGIGIEDWLEKGLISEKSFEMCICFWRNLIVPILPCLVDRTLKSVSYLLTNLPQSLKTMCMNTSPRLWLWLCVCMCVCGGGGGCCVVILCISCDVFKVYLNIVASSEVWFFSIKNNYCAYYMYMEWPSPFSLRHKPSLGSKLNLKTFPFPKQKTCHVFTFCVVSMLVCAGACVCMYSLRLVSYGQDFALYTYFNYYYNFFRKCLALSPFVY